MRNAECGEHLRLRLVALAIRDGHDLRFGEDHSLLALDVAHDNRLRKAPVVGGLFAPSFVRQVHDFHLAGYTMATLFR